MHLNITSKYLYVRRVVTGAYHDSGLRALMIVSRSCHIAMLKHNLLRVQSDEAITNICIFM